MKYKDKETGKTLVFLTNNLEFKPITIAQLYKQRWQVELFFKWIKQNLHVETFFGQSENAVKTQIWIAICAYLLMAVFKKRYNLDAPLSDILHFCSDILYEQIPVQQAFQELNYTTTTVDSSKQLSLPGL